MSNADAIDDHVYEVRPRKNKRGVDLISNVLPFGRLWYGEPNAINNAVSYAHVYSRAQSAVIRVYDEARQRDRNTRAQGRFQRMVSRHSILRANSTPVFRSNLGACR